MSNLVNKHIADLFKNKKILKNENLTNAFGAYCNKITMSDSTQFIIKGLRKPNNNYNYIYYEGKSLKFMHKKFPELFPKILHLKKNIIVMDYIKHNKIKNKKSDKDLAVKLASIHKITNKKFGFDFDTPIGGIRQPCKYQYSWIDFYANKRLGMIFEKINSNNPMPKKINKNIENILKNLKNLIPNNPKPSLIHGDLWEGNILFHEGNLVGLIDPGIYYAHNELELSYLNWFNYVGSDFINNYNELNPVDKIFYNYQEVYQLYYSLLNIHLWSREYISDAYKLSKKFS